MTTDSNKIIDIEADIDEFDVLADEDYEAYMKQVMSPITGGGIEMARLLQDLDLATRTLKDDEVRYLVDLYYSLQDFRMQAAAQVRSAKSDEPNMLLDYIGYMFKTFEGRVQEALGRYAASRVPGQWALSVKGIGPVIASGLLAHVNLDTTTSVGALWRHAGYDPSDKWLGKEGAAALVKEIAGSTGKQEVSDEHLFAIAQRIHRKPMQLRGRFEREYEGETMTCDKLVAMLAKRPWNERLHTLGWKIGQSFMKSSNRKDSFYGQFYKDRKLWELERNQRKEYADQAEVALRRIGKDTEAYKYLKDGMLPPLHIQARARRYAVKIFFSHFWSVCYEDRYNQPAPRPHAIQFLGHTHEIKIPNWPMEETVPGKE